MSTRLCAGSGQLAVRISDSLRRDDRLDASWPTSARRYDTLLATPRCTVHRSTSPIPEAHRDGAKEVNAVAKCGKFVVS